MSMPMPCKPHGASWMALLGTCRIHGNVKIREHIAKRILELEPEMLLIMCCYLTSIAGHLCENVEQ
jgi:hypothetical protein